MPITNGTYISPTWANNGPPSFNSTELQAISDTTAIVPTLVRPNLLDNWYFVGGGSQQGGWQFPINTRGQTNYGGNGATIDRWKIEGGSGTNSIIVNSGHLTVSGVSTTNFYRQYFGFDATGLLATWSLLTADGMLYTHSGTMQSTGISAYYETPFGNVRFNNSTSDQSGISITVGAGKSVNVVAVKAELGDTQTLAHQENGTWVLNEIPNYEEQLFRCQTSTVDSSDAYANKPNLVGFEVNPNLLDNWYFVGGGSQQGGGQFPINQRGNTSYSGGGIYTIDRWITLGSNSSVTLTSAGMQVYKTTTGDNGRNTQRIATGLLPVLEGKQVTFSVLFDTLPATSYVGIQLLWDNSVLHEILVYPTSDKLCSYTVVIPTTGYSTSDIARQRFQITTGVEGSTNAAVIAAVKLELGDTQTLAHQENGEWVLNEIPNFQEQLYRCKTSTADSSDTYTNKTNAYTDIVAPTSHASSATTYGTGTGSNYGHLKLSDSTSSTSSTGDGVAATPAAAKAAYDLAASKTSNTGTITAVQANGTSVATSGTANIPAASTSAYGVTQLSTSTSSTSTTTAATPSAIKAVNDRLTYGNTDLTAGTSSLATGVLYAYYT